MAAGMPDANALQSVAEPAVADPIDEELPSDPAANPQWDLERQGLLGDVAPLLALIALGLIGVFVFRILDSLLPPRLLDPEWQLRQVERLIVSAPFALIAVSLLLIGACLDSGSRVMRWFQRCRGLARWVCIGYLLLVPLQMHAMVQLADKLNEQGRQGIRSLERTRVEVSRSFSVSSLNQAFSSLPGKPQLPPDFKGNTAPIRSNALRVLDQRIAQLEKQALQRKNQRVIDGVISSARGCGMSLLLTVVFSGMAMSDPQQGSWFEQILRRGNRIQERRRRRRAEEFERLEELEAVNSHYAELEPLQPAAATASPHAAHWLDEPDDDDLFLEELAREQASLETLPRPTSAEAPEPSPRLPRRGRPASVDPFLEQLAEEAEALEAVEGPSNTPDIPPGHRG